MRTIEFRIDGLECKNKETIEAIGYLTTCALTEYDKVTIYRTPGGSDEPEHNDFIAYYQNTQTHRTYEISALWNGTAYGFHPSR